MNQRDIPAPATTLFSLKNQTVFGLSTLFILVFGFGFWAGMTRIPGAVIAPAQFEVSGNRNAIQHSEGGLLAEVLIEEGTIVVANQPIATLTSPHIQSELAVIKARLAEIRTRRARLEAERDGSADLLVTAELAAMAFQDQSVGELLADQRRLLAARREVTQSQVEQLRRRLVQISAQIAGIDAQIRAKHDEMAILNEDIDRSQRLQAKGHAQIGRIDALRRDQSQLAGDLGALGADRAQAEGRAVEIGLEIIRLGAIERESAAEQLATLIPQEVEIAQSLIATQSRVDRLTLRAPSSGTILGLRHSRSGGVLQPAEALAWVVPSDQPLILAARIATSSATELYPGQIVRVQLHNHGLFDDKPIEGRLHAISADALRDPETGAGFFRAEVTLGPVDIDRLRQGGLMPGMTAEAFFVTSERSPLTWLFKPFTRYLSGAMRES